MIGEQKTYIRTWEELVMDRIAQAFHSRDQENPELFDSILDEIEMLFGLVPEIHQELMAAKEHKQSIVKNAVKEAERKAMTAPDDITKKFVYNKEVYAIEWDYRSDMLEEVLKLMGSYQKIPFTKQSRAEITSTPYEPKKKEEVAEIEPKPEGKQIEKTPQFTEAK